MLYSDRGWAQFSAGSQGGPAENLLFLNRTARFIAECLLTETTRKAILERMAGIYVATREELAESLDITLNSLRNVHALAE